MRNDKRAEKEQRIAEAAYAILAERGYGGTSMLAIAKAARASNETLYNWYGDKAGLFRALVQANVAEISDMLMEQDAETPCLEALQSSGEKLLVGILGPRAIALNQAAACDPSGTLGQVIARFGRDRIAPLFRDLMSRAVDQGALSGAPDALTETFLALLIADHQIRRVIGALPPPSPEDCAARAKMALDMLCKIAPPAP